MGRRLRRVDNVLMTTDQRSSRILVVIGALVTVLIGVAVMLAVRPMPDPDPTTPEGTAQGYFQAVLDGDEDLAFGYLTEALSDQCDAGQMRHVTPDGARVVITRSEVGGADAELEVEITETYGEGPFDAGSDTFDETLVMERHGDRWLIAEIPWPIHSYCLEEDR
jgi:hypothetical protein